MRMALSAAAPMQEQAESTPILPREILVTATVSTRWQVDFP